MSNKFKKIILNIFPVTTLYDVVFKIVSGLNQVTFRVVETVTEVIPTNIYSVTFRIVKDLGNSVVFNIVSDSMNSVVFQLIDGDYTKNVIFNVVEVTEVPRKVLFYVIEGDDDKVPGDCIPLDC